MDIIEVRSLALEMIKKEVISRNITNIMIDNPNPIITILIKDLQVEKVTININLTTNIMTNKDKGTSSEKNIQKTLMRTEDHTKTKNLMEEETMITLRIKPNHFIKNKTILIENKMVSRKNTKEMTILMTVLSKNKIK
jgi:hypothetical protein